jgi:integrase
MSEGSVFKRKDGKYCAKYKGADGKYHYIYRKSKAEAKKALREALKQRDEGKTPVARRNSVTVGESLESYLGTLEDSVSQRTRECRKYLVRNHLLPKLGDKKVAALSPDAVRTFYRGSTLAPSSIKLPHTILRNAPPPQCMEGVKPPRVQGKEMDILSKQELLHLLDTVKDDKYEGAFLLMGLCACRVGEALSAKFEDIDFDKGTIQIRRTLWKGTVSQPKTQSSRRTITLPVRASEALRKLRSTSDGQGCLFASNSGLPICYANFYTRHWKPAIRRAGLPESLTPHKRRHGAASLLLNEGVPLPIVSRYNGHANPGITAKIYAHVLDGTSHVAASAMDNLLGSSP